MTGQGEAPERAAPAARALPGAPAAPAPPAPPLPPAVPDPAASAAPSFSDPPASPTPATAPAPPTAPTPPAPAPAKSLAWWWCIHPLLAAVAPILHIIAQNEGGVFWIDLWRPTAWLLAAAAVLFAALRWLMGSLPRAALTTTAILAGAFGVSVAWGLLGLAGLRGIVGQSEMLFALIWLAAFAVGLAFVLRRPSWVREGNKVTAVFLAVFLVSPVAGTLRSWPDWKPEAPPIDFAQDAWAKALGADAARPDIYYVVLDGYASAPVLSQVYGDDNAAFRGALRQRGFEVHDEARANYLQTRLSLASILNMEHVRDLGVRDVGDLDARIRLNRVAGILDDAGYEIVHVRSSWGPTTSQATTADTTIPCHALSEVEVLLLRFSILDSLFGVASKSRRRNIDCAFDAMAEVAKKDAPTFTFVHMIAPHPPYVFDPSGGRPPFDPGTFAHGWENKEGYLGQMAYINGRVLEAVDRIFATAGEDSVIVVMGDHGSAHRFITGGGFPARPMPGNAAFDGALWERAGPLTAIHWPSSMPAPDPAAPATSIDTFRILFDGLFGTSYGPKPGCTFYASYDDVLALQDVTQVLDPGAAAACGQASDPKPKKPPPRREARVHGRGLPQVLGGHDARRPRP